MFIKGSFKDLEGEWELNPTELGAIFLHQKWGYDRGNGKMEIPREPDIEDVVGTLVSELMASDENIGKMVNRGRFMVYRDPDAKGSFDVYLNVGFVWSHELTQDEEDWLNGK